MDTLLMAVILQVVVGVATDRICKWLDRRKQRPKPRRFFGR